MEIYLQILDSTDNPAVLNKPVEQSLSSSPGAKSKRCLILMNKLWMPFSIDLHPTKNVSAPEGWRAVLSQAKLRHCIVVAGRTIDLSQVTKIDSLHLGNSYTLSCLESFKCSALQNFVSVNFGLEEYRKAAETDKFALWRAYPPPKLTVIRVTMPEQGTQTLEEASSPEVYNRDEESKVNLVEWFTVNVDNKQILPTLKFKGDHEMETTLQRHVPIANPLSRLPPSRPPLCNPSLFNIYSSPPPSARLLHYSRMPPGPESGVRKIIPRAQLGKDNLLCYIVWVPNMLAFEIRPHGDTRSYGHTRRYASYQHPHATIILLISHPWEPPLSSPPKYLRNTPMVVIEQGATGPGIPETGSERGPPPEAKKFLQVMVSVLNGAVSMADPEGPAAQNGYLLE
ncbi:hypothetical protein C8J56DRAFT_899715 [Mycena floridula]|nr:hypothetical protein C8J56DRAFT_899715 [Mycena floridula]